MNRHRIYRFADFVVDPESWKLTRNGRAVHLEPSVLKLLVYLISHRDRLVTRKELVDTVWSDTVVSDSALTKAVARLRKALADDSTEPRFIETVHSRGYRFMADVTELQPDQPASRAPSRPRVLHFVAAGALIMVISALFLLPGSPLRQARDTDRIRSLAVLPIKNLTGEERNDYFAAGLQDSLITELALIDGLRVTSRQSTARYRDSDMALPEIARELGVDALVEGSLLNLADEIEVNLQLMRGDNDEHLWSRRFKRDASLVFALSVDAAGAIGSQIGLTAVTRPKKPVDTRAIQAYWQGLALMDRLTPDSLQAAIGRLREATDIEPGFGLAWGNLAAAYALRTVIGHAPAPESIEQARAAALNAVAADDHNYIGYSALGWVKLWSGDRTGGCASFERALRLNPSARWAIHGDADCLMLDGRFDESVIRLRELQVISPFVFMDNLPLTFHLFIARDYDAAIEAIEDLEERFPGFPAGVNRSLVYWAQGALDAALAEERRKLEQRRDNELLDALEDGLAAGGPRNAMRAVADALVERSASSFVDPFVIGKTYAHAAAVDEAITWLEKAVDNRSFEIIHMPFRPDLDPLRQDPRFNALLLRSGLVDTQDADQRPPR